MEEEQKLTPHYAALGVTEEQYQVMLRFKKARLSAFTNPEYSALWKTFNDSFADDERAQKRHCILYYAMIGSTPPIDFGPYVFDIGGKYQAWMLKLEELASKDSQ